MEIFCISRSRMEDLMVSEDFLAKDFNIISVIDHDAEFIFAEPTSPNVLQLRFSDIEGDEPEGCMGSDKWILFTEDHAKQIIDFMDGMDKSKNLICQCSAGISRSGAIGDFARTKFKIPFGDFILLNPQIIPNAHIRRTLFKIQGWT